MSILQGIDCLDWILSTQQVGNQVESKSDDQCEGDIEASEVMLAARGELGEEDIVELGEKAAIDALEIGEVICAGGDMGDEENDRGLQSNTYDGEEDNALLLSEIHGGVLWRWVVEMSREVG